MKTASTATYAPPKDWEGDALKWGVYGLMGGAHDSDLRTSFALYQEEARSMTEKMARAGSTKKSDDGSSEQ